MPAVVLKYFTNALDFGAGDLIHNFAIVCYYTKALEIEVDLIGDSIHVSPELSNEFLVPVHLLFARCLTKSQCNSITVTPIIKKWMFDNVVVLQAFEK